MLANNRHFPLLPRSPDLLAPIPRLLLPVPEVVNATFVTSQIAAKPTATSPVVDQSVTEQLVTEQPVTTQPAIPQAVAGKRAVAVASGDLVIVGDVLPGAQVMAAGDIHVYGALRGKAFAGINGNQHARIYCLSCEPQLVAICGCYKVFDFVPRDLRHRQVEFALADGALQYVPLG